MHNKPESLTLKTMLSMCIPPENFFGTLLQFVSKCIAAQTVTFVVMLVFFDKAETVCRVCRHKCMEYFASQPRPLLVRCKISALMKEY